MKALTCVLICFALCLGACKTTKTASTNTNKAKSGDTEMTRGVNDSETRGLFIDATTEMIRGKYPEAKDMFLLVLDRDPSNHAAMYNIAKLSVALREYEAAVDYGKRALNGDSGNYWYYKILQQAYEEKGDYAQAIQLLEEISQRFPDRLEERIHLAELYLKDNQVNKAIGHLEVIEQQVGFNEETALRKLDIFRQQGKHDQALEITQKLIHMDPTNGRFYQWQFESYKEMGREEEGVATLKSLLAIEPDNGFALLTLADYYKEKDDLETSDQYLFKAFKNPEIDVAGKVYIIERLMNFVEVEPEVIPRVKELGKILYQAHPEASEIFAIQGKIKRLENQPDSAQYFLRKALEQDPANISNWQELIEADYEAAQFDQLFKDTEEALEFYPNQEQFLFFHGIAGARTNDAEAAIYAFEKIRKKGSSDKRLLVQTYAELGKLYQQKGQNDLSDERFKQALELAPSDQDLMQTYGWSLYQMQDYDGAVNWLNQAIKANQNPSADLLERYGDALFKAGDEAEARKQWEKAISKGAKGLNIEEKMRN